MKNETQNERNGTMKTNQIAKLTAAKDALADALTRAVVAKAAAEAVEAELAEVTARAKVAYTKATAAARHLVACRAAVEDAETH